MYDFHLNVIPMTLCNDILTAVLREVFKKILLNKNFLSGYEHCNVGLCVAMIHYGISFGYRYPEEGKKKEVRLQDI